MTTRLSGTGIWSSILRYGDAGEAATLAAELEALGYSALWVPDVGGDLFGPLGNLLGATTTATIATGILNVWMHTPEETAAEHARLTAEHGPRFLCGIGISHRPLIDHVNEPGTYRKPVETMAAYLDGLDAAPTPLAPDGPGDRRARPEDARARPHPHGRHPPVPRHAGADRKARAPASVPTASSPASRASSWRPTRRTAREIARLHLKTYLGLPNYSNNWKRQGFTDDDLADGGSDRLVDALVVWGDETTIAARVQEHRDAGADHVCIQVLTDDPRGLPVDQWRSPRARQSSSAGGDAAGLLGGHGLESETVATQMWRAFAVRLSAAVSMAVVDEHGENQHADADRPWDPSVRGKAHRQQHGSGSEQDEHRDEVDGVVASDDLDPTGEVGIIGHQSSLDVLDRRIDLLVVHRPPPSTGRFDSNSLLPLLY